MNRSRSRIEIVFLLAGCAARRAELLPRTREFLARADFDVLARALAERRLLPLIGSRAVEAAPDLVPDRFRDAVAAARATARARGLATEAATAAVSAQLAAAGIRALPLKGPLLAAEAHGDIGLRETSDIDLLVTREELDAAVHVLSAHGFSGPEGIRRANGLPDLHFEMRHPDLPRIDLHWRVHWYESGFSADMVERATPGADGLLRADPADMLASLLLFHARDGFHGVRVAADAAAWWDRHGHSLPERPLESHASRYPELAPALTAAAVAIEQLTGAPAVAWLGRSASGGRRVALATRLADWSQDGDRDQLRANISLVGGLLGPPGALPEFARRELTVPYASRPASASHAMKTIARFGLALWTVRGDRRWATAA